METMMLAHNALMMYSLREYKESDKYQVNDLALSAFTQYSDEYKDWKGFSKKITQMSRLAETSELIVAEVNSKIVGAVVYIAPNKIKAPFFKPEWAVIRMLVVSPKFRGKGIGQSLSETCLNRARRDKAETIALHTSEIMKVALAMYLNMGFLFHSKAPDIHGVKYGIYTRKLQA